MKKLLLAIVLVIAISISTLAAVPTGWNGWTWGKSFSSVEYMLTYDSSMTIPNYSYSPIYLYKRNNESKYQIGIYWDKVTYAFYNKQFIGIGLAIMDYESTKKAVSWLNSIYGQAEIVENVKLMNVAVWIDPNSCALLMYEANSNLCYVFLGTSKYIESTLEWLSTL